MTKNINFLRIIVLLLANTAPLSCNDYSDAIYQSIDDITNPTEKDYEKIQNYIYYGIIPYVDRIIDWQKEPYARDFKITPTDGNSIVYEIVPINNKKDKKNNCIVLYGSYNDGEPEKIKALVSQIESSDFKGHLIYRIGGWPNLANGDLVTAHIPGAYVVSALCEAYSLGFKQALWIDGTMTPETDLNDLFKKISKADVYAYELKFSFKNFFRYDSQKMAYNLANERAKMLYATTTSIVGINFKDKTAQALMEDWHGYTKTKEQYSLIPYMEKAVFSYICNMYYSEDHFPRYESHVNTADISNLEFTKE